MEQSKEINQIEQDQKTLIPTSGYICCRSEMETGL